jgi:post-segregation antitoxin (ccd killing protein)
MFDEDRMSTRKTAKIITRVTEDDYSWLQQEADTLGVDLSTLVRMTLRRERNERKASRQQLAVS